MDHEGCGWDGAGNVKNLETLFLMPIGDDVLDRSGVEAAFQDGGDDVFVVCKVPRWLRGPRASLLLG